MARRKHVPWDAWKDPAITPLGAGEPAKDGDTRVRCWFCAVYTHHLQCSVNRLVEGSYRQEWYDVRTCAKGLGHDPFILRRCEAFKPISPQYRMRLPDEAYQRGWRADYGDDECMLGRKNTIAC